jgi:hypothetical protein
MSAFRARLAALASIGLIVLLSATGVAAAEPETNSPAPPPRSTLATCPASSFCMYEHKDFVGNILVIPAGTAYPDLRVLACPGCRSSKHNNNDGTWSDQMSSWVNNTSMVYCWYWHENFVLRDSTMNAGTSLLYVGKDPNDQASSISPC